MELLDDGGGGGMVVQAGPAGNYWSGKAWEEPFPGLIDKIFVSHGGSIRSIQMVYRMVNGELVLTERRGGQGPKFNSIQFENGEYITKISGHLSYWLKNVKSLTIETNREIYGPFGEVNGTPFEFAVQDEFIKGLHGRSSKGRLNAIGVLIDTGVGRPLQETESEQRRLNAAATAAGDGDTDNATTSMLVAVKGTRWNGRENR